ncbi:hypothetical protein [Streptomyces sp. NBRC 109706]|uniref:hypothetical protein n=1 Tax=Streptomyces sp. NBRC 109706 TaxID=1550035 RepID=UPI000782F539|nr:hypothetical protein [Streptomyces sp. NBRC 109706]
MGEKRVRFGVPRWVAGGWGVAAGVGLTASVLAFREELSTLGTVAALLGGLAGWRLLAAWTTGTTLTSYAVRERRLGAEERITPWSAIEAVVLTTGTVRLRQRAGGERQLAVPRRLFGRRRFARELTRLRAAVADHAEDLPVREADDAPSRWRRLGPGSLVVLAVLALVTVGLRRDEPWHAPWWPGSETVGALPDACDLIERHGVELLPEDASMSGDPGVPSFPGEFRYCFAGGLRTHVELTLHLFPWEGPDERSPDERARAYDAEYPLVDGEPEEINGRPWLVAESHGESVHVLFLRQQRANLIVQVEFSLSDAEIGPDERAELERFAERVVAELHG